MPRVRITTPIATKDRAYNPGQVADVPGPLASAWVKNGNAEIVRGEQVETPEIDEVPEVPEVPEVDEPETEQVETPEAPAPAKKAAPAKRAASRKK